MLFCRSLCCSVVNCVVLVVNCVVLLLIVLVLLLFVSFYVLFVCKCCTVLLPPGVNPVAVNKYINIISVSYHINIISYQVAGMKVNCALHQHTLMSAA